ncbi:MAG: cofactor-independent phosphoglycerate mutase [Thermodesulfobacteriota bacterium]
MKTVILVGDGMGDYAHEDLGGKTVLEAARTPGMDHLAQNGKMALLQTVPDGMLPGSDVANLSLLGYRPEEFYTGRSPLEAASMGVDLGPEDIAFRLNLVNVREKDGAMTMIDYSAGHISTAEAHELIDSLQAALPAEYLALYPGISYRHLLVVDADIADLKTVPPHDYPEKDVTPFWQSYSSVPLLADFIRKAKIILADHPVNLKRVSEGKLPANCVWLWGQGKAPAMLDLQELYGVSGALISAVDLLKGIGVYAGMEVLEVEGATGYLDTNYQGKVEAALDSLTRHDLVFVHVEAPDETGHQGLLREKIQAVEDFDSKIVRPIFAGLEKLDSFRLVVCMDHFTPVSLKTHTNDPVPVAIYDPSQLGQNDFSSYTEESGRQAGVIYNDGAQFMKAVLA